MIGFYSIFASSEFVTAFWIFVGIVAGALVQHFLNRLTQIRQSKNAFAVLKTEVDLNLDELGRFRDLLASLREGISAQQVSEDNIFITMQGFDYSAVAPLVNQGYFHFMLGPESAKKYFEFMRFFNNNHAQALTNLLKQEHLKGSSLNCIQWIDRKAEELGIELGNLQSAKLKRGQVRLMKK